jgi:N-acetylmuramoyl-L-alanine amidase CwlA
MDDIKSALEIAMEKVNKLDEPTEEERLTWKYVPEGEKLATRYLKHKLNLLEELNKYDENIRKYVIDGASGVMARNISLPKNDFTKQVNKKAMEGLKLIKNDKVGVENIFSKIRYIFNHYAEEGAQQKKQAYESLKTELAEKIQQAMQQQLGTLMGVKIDVEQQPQFQQEWRKLQTQIDSQYVNHLNEYTKELVEIA